MSHERHTDMGRTPRHADGHHRVSLWELLSNKCSSKAARRSSIDGRWSGSVSMPSSTMSRSPTGISCGKMGRMRSIANLSYHVRSVTRSGNSPKGSSNRANCTPTSPR